MKRIFLPLAILALAALNLGLADPAMAQNTNRVPYKERVTLKVGEAMVIHGARGYCGKLPTKAELKPIKFTTGTVVFGKEGVRKSKACGGDTPVYEAIFKAEAKGNEKIELFGDPISITVK